MSVTSTVKLNVPLLVGVPLNIPVTGSNVTPAGNVPEETLHA